MKLYGKQWTRRELEARVGQLEQIGGIRRFQSAEGTETGVEQIQVRSGAGLSYYVTPSKGLDISFAELGGTPISWQSANGDVHPAYYDSQSNEWLRTASGGLLMTCGLANVGSPCEDQGRSFGQHGRIHHLPARQVAAEGTWSQDEYTMRIRGVLNETSIHGDHLRLSREIVTTMGENRITITDVVENAGFKPCAHLMLYHFNFGFPLMSEHTFIQLPSAEQVRQAGGTETTEAPVTWQAPDPHAGAVYYHTLFDPEAYRDGKAEVVIRNPQFPAFAAAAEAVPAAVRLRWSVGSLPRLSQWQMSGQGTHVLSIEPANCWVAGRKAERDQGTLRMMEPGETIRYELELTID